MIEPLAWAVILANNRCYGRFDFQWEARAIADALQATDGVQATVEPLYLSTSLTDAEREAIANGIYLCEGEAGQANENINANAWAKTAGVLRGLMSRTGDCPASDNAADRNSGATGSE